MLRQRLIIAIGAVGLALAAAPTAPAKDYPRMVAAPGELKEARRELKEAGNDFGGHKAKAIAACDRAFEQLDKALRAVGVDPVYVPPSKDVYKSYKRYPYMHHALAELREARATLKDASHDFHGHRGKALEATDDAIVQLEKALDFKR